MSAEIPRCPSCSIPVEAINAWTQSVYVEDHIEPGYTERVAKPCGHLLTVEQYKALDEALRPLWRFNVPEVPAHVTAFKDGAGVVWIRGLVGPRRQRWAVWSDDPQAWQSAEWVDVRTALARLPLVECPDPRRTP